MADDKPAEVEVATTAEEEPKQEDKSATARKKSLGGLDSSSVLSGPRQRKKADHFQVKVKEKADFVIKAGKGAKLSEIPNVHYLLGKLKTDDELLTSLHNLLYKRPGTAHRRRKNLYEFSGLTFDDDDKEKELEKLQERLGKWTIPLLNGALDVFELPRGNGDEGKKEAKVERLLRFLDEPKQLSEKDLATQAAKKKDAAKAKKEKEQKSKTPKSTAKGGRKSEGGQESTKKRIKRDESDEEGGEEPSEDEEEEAEPEPEEPPKKRAKKEDAEVVKKVAEKKTPPSRKAAGKKRKADDEEPAEGASAEAVDSVGASSGLPDDDAIKEATLALLEVSDVNKTTVKDLLAKLMEKFGKDLKKKKALIKRVAVDYAQTKAAASEDAGEAEADEANSPPPAKMQKGGDQDEDGEKAEATAGDAEEETKADGSTEEDTAEPDAEPKAEAPKEPVAEAEAKGEAAPEANEADAEPKAVVDAEPMAEAAEEPMAEAEAEPMAEADSEPMAEVEAKGEAAPEANEADAEPTAGTAMETEESKGEAAANGSAVEKAAGVVEDAKESKD